MASNVRSDWKGRHAGAFDKDWLAKRPDWNSGHWHRHRHWNSYPARHWWRPASVALITQWFTGWWDKPSYYNYGETVYYVDESVYYGDQVAATAEQYYDQAEAIAQSVPEVDDEKTEWMPLGVFALTQSDTDAANMVLQLAVSKEGIVAGTFYNETTDTTHPVEGMVDKKTQRAAWRCADGTNPDLVMETGVYNLTKDETEALAHFGKEKTQSWLMVRLPEPEADASQ